MNFLLRATHIAMTAALIAWYDFGAIPEDRHLGVEILLFSTVSGLALWGAVSLIGLIPRRSRQRHLSRQRTNLPGDRRALIGGSLRGVAR